MKYVYHFHCRIEGGITGDKETCFIDGLYIAAKKIVDEKTGEILMHGGGDVVEQEDCSLDLIRENGVLVGQLGKTHFFNPANGYRLEKIINKEGYR